jgi:hypothetical protein
MLGLVNAIWLVFGTLTNVDNTISGGGQLGNGQLTLVNEASGVIEGNGGALIINTGGNTISNAGLMEGSLVIDSAINNIGTGNEWRESRRRWPSQRGKRYDRRRNPRIPEHLRREHGVCSLRDIVEIHRARTKTVSPRLDRA